MTGAREFGARVLGMLAWRGRDRALDEEIETHLDLLTQEFVARGLPPDRARAAARREFGGIDTAKESARDERGLPAIESMLQDVRFALRQLRRQPGFAAAAILTLAVGIGATTGIFSLFDVAMLRPLPFLNPDRLVVIQEQIGTLGLAPVSPSDAEVWRRSTTSFEGIALLYPEGASLTGTGEPEHLAAERVSASFFRVLGVQAQLGRVFLDEEETPGRDRVAVLSAGLWQRRFNADPEIVGQTILLDGIAHEVVGVLPSGIRPPHVRQLLSINLSGVKSPELWRPLALTPEQRPPIGNYSFASLARLKPDVSIERARTELAAVQANLLRELPAKGDVRTHIAPLQEQLTTRARSGLQILFLAVASVLLIGCANIANLLLAQALVRRREIAVRQALGATTRRVMRQLLIENLTLTALGGIAAIGVAYVVMRYLVASAPADVPRLDEVTLDARILLFALASSAVSALLVGSLPAWRLRRVDLTEAMTVRGASGGTRSAGRVRSLLVASQIGMSAACLVVAGLLLQSFVRLLNVDKGFDSDRIVTLDLNLPTQRYPNDQARQQFAATLLDGVRSIRGVTSASVASRSPLSGTGANSAISRPGTTLPIPERPLSDFRSVTTDYFQTVGLPLRSGRLFTAGDEGRRVAVISETLARQAWPGEDAIGQSFRFGGNPNAPLFEVIGIVGAARNRALDEPPTPSAYVQYSTGAQTVAALLIQTAGGVAPLSAQVRGILTTIDPQLASGTPRPLDDLVSDAVAPRRFQMQLVLGFAAVASLLAMLGVYGVMAYAVAQRTSEFGVRLALGAQPRSVHRMIIRESAVLLAAGLAVAVLAVWSSASLVRGLLFGIGATDPRTMAAVLVLTTVFALAAAYVPGRRASRVNPMTALRAE